MFRRLSLIVLLFVPFSVGIGANNTTFTLPDSTEIIIVDKANFSLILADKYGAIEKEYGIACAMNYGNKQEVGDNKTPEGVFPINQILFSHNLYHDFGDGNGPIAHAYGPWFLRLDVPDFTSIGIHGTHLPESIGTRSTEGCIRLTNEDIKELKRRVYVGMPVMVLPDSCGNHAITDIFPKEYDYAFYPSSYDSSIDSLFEAASKAGKSVYRIPEGLSNIRESLDSIKSSRCVVFHEDTTNASIAIKEILLSYVLRDTSIQCLFYPTDSISFTSPEPIVEPCKEHPDHDIKLLAAILIIFIVPGISFLLKRALKRKK